MKVEELEKELKQGKLDSLYLLYGDEKFLLEKVLKKIHSLFGKTINGINYITIDETNVNSIISNIETPCFGFEKKLIVAKNTGLFKKDTKGKAKKNDNTIKAKLNEYLNNNFNDIKDFNILVFVENEIEKSDLAKFIEKNGIICNFEFQRANQLQARIKAITNAYKVNIDNSTLIYFIECCGTSMQELINEIRKLIEYVGVNGTITKQDIDNLSIKKIESVIFDLTDSLGKKDIANALQILKELLYNKEPIQKILITLYNHLKKIYLTMLADEYRVNIAEALNLKPNQMFLTTKYKKQASYFKKEELRNTLQALIDLDYKTKQGQLDINVGLEAILCMI